MISNAEKMNAFATESFVILGIKNVVPSFLQENIQYLSLKRFFHN